MPHRIKAFFVHLCVSVITAFFISGIVFGIWYPSPLHHALGVTGIFSLLLLVDVTLGPLLTLLIYEKGKRTLVFDLTVIACLQLTAMGYGVWTVAEGRPLWVVFNVDRFDLVQAVDIDKNNLSSALPEYKGANWLGPLWVGAAKPADTNMRQTIMFEALLGGADIAQRPELYKPLSEFVSVMQSRALDLEQLRSVNEYVQVTDALGQWPEATGWLPLMARPTPMVVLLSRNNSEVLSIVPLHPW